MIITQAALGGLKTVLKSEFSGAYKEGADKADWQKVAGLIRSSSASNTYGWLKEFPQMREWVGDRVIKGVAEGVYQLPNKKYESTLGVARTDIEDDNLGMYRSLASSHGQEVVSFQNRNVYGALAGGFTGLCYDGQPYFDTEHPVFPSTDGTGTPAMVSNIIGSETASGAPWFLLDASRVIKPIILQQRTDPEFEALTSAKDSDQVFMKDQYLYGIRWRGAFGYGFWQMAVASKEPLTESNFNKAVAAMGTFKRDGGDPMGISPTLLVVPMSLRAAARELIEVDRKANGASNPNYKAVECLVTSWV